MTRRLAALCIVLTIALGIASRKVPLGVFVWDKSLGDALYTVVKREKERGPWEAKFGRHAQAALAPLLELDEKERTCDRAGGHLRRLGFGAGSKAS